MHSDNIFKTLKETHNNKVWLNLVKLPTSIGSSKKEQEFQKSVYFCFIDYSKAFDCVDHNKLWKILKEMGYQTIWPASWEIRIQVKKQQLELHMEQQAVFKLGKEYVKAVYCHPAYLTYMQSTSHKMLAGWSKSWNQDCWEKYQKHQIYRWHQPYGRKQRWTKEPFFFFQILFYLFIFLYFTILYWFCHTSTWIHHGCTCVPSPELPSHLPPHTIPLEGKQNKTF